MDEHSQRAQVVSVGPQEVRLNIGGQTLAWPRQALPQDVKEGDSVTLQLYSEQTARLAQAERARAILAEILGGRS